jgi:hypothetical protein
MMTFEHHLGKLVADGKVDKKMADTFLGKKERKVEAINNNTQSQVKVPGVTAASGIRVTGVAENTQAAAGGFFRRKS